MNKMIYDIEKRTYILEKCYKSVTKDQRSLGLKYKNSKASANSIIKNFLKKFKETSSVENSSKVRLESTHKLNEAKNIIIDLVLLYQRLQKNYFQHDGVPSYTCNLV